MQLGLQFLSLSLGHMMIKSVCPHTSGTTHPNFAIFSVCLLLVAVAESSMVILCYVMYIQFCWTSCFYNGLYSSVMLLLQLHCSVVYDLTLLLHCTDCVRF